MARNSIEKRVNRLNPTFIFLGSLFLNGDLYVCQKPCEVPISEKQEIYYNYEPQTYDKENQLYKIKSPGLYMFKQKDEKVHYVYYYKDDGYIFEDLPVKIEKGNYYYKQPLEGYFISKTQQNDLTLVGVWNEYYLYKQTLTNDGWYENYFIDKTPPEVYLRSNHTRIEGNQLKTNQSFEIVVEDALLEDGEKIKVETYQLKDGLHQIPYCFQDALGNETKGVMEVEVDKTKPTMHLPNNDQLYLNTPYHLTITEPHLDLKKSHIYLDDQPIDIHHPTIQASGMLKVHLEDTFGNINQYQIEIIYDQTKPTYTLNLNQNKVTLIVDEALKKQKLYLNNNLMTSNELILEEGNYHLKGMIEDRCGNITQIDEDFRIDLTAPTIVYPKLENHRLNTALPYVVTFHDRFLKTYTLNIYLDDTCIKTYQGTNNDTISFVLEDKQGLSTYTIEGIVDDGMYQTAFKETIVIDQSLKPIDYSINGAQASKVQKLTLLSDTTFDTKCDEGMTIYQLYKQETLLHESKQPSYIVYAYDKPTHLVITVIDESGHRKQKTIYFEYPLQNEEPQEIPKEEIVQTVNKQKQEPTMVPVPLKVVEKKKNVGLLYPFLGVILCVLFIFMLRRKTLHLTHSKKTSEPISNTQANDTILCDQDDTVYLSPDDTTLLDDSDQS